MSLDSTTASWLEKDLDSQQLFDSLEAVDLAGSQAKGDTASAQSMLHDRERLLEQNDHLVRLSQLLMLCVALLIILSIIVFLMMRQLGRIHKIEIELASEKEMAAALEIENTELQLEEKTREEQKLKDDLDLKQATLASKLLHISRMNDFLNKMKEELVRAKGSLNNSSISHYFEKTESDISKNLNGDIWEEFEMYYAAGNNSFVERLSAIHPSLTINDKRLSYLIMRGFTTKEIASILSKTYRAVEMARFRLRNKLGLDKGTRLEAWFNAINSQNN